MMSKLFLIEAARGRPILRGHDAYWSLIRTAGSGGRLFTLREITDAVNGPRQNVQDYLARLRAAEIVELAEIEQDGAIRRNRYRLASRPVDAPCLNRSGRRGAQGLGQLQMWTAMRALPQFDKHEIAATASTDEVLIESTTAERYLRTLATAGYLTIRQPARKGRNARAALYRLTPRMNTGPKPPAILRGRMVLDRNTLEIAGEVLAEEVAA